MATSQTNRGDPSSSKCRASSTKGAVRGEVERERHRRARPSAFKLMVNMRSMLLVVPSLTTLLVAPASAQAPPREDKLPRIAIFVTSPIEGQIENAVKLFERAMGELGFAHGKNVALVREPPADHLR